MQMITTADDSDVPPAESWEICGKTATVLHARLGWSLPCGLERGHEGACQPKGHCIRHGDYYGIACPHWPTCAGAEEMKRRHLLRRGQS